MGTKKNNTTGLFLLAGGGIFGIWSLAVIVAGLHSLDWNVIEFVRLGLVASGMIQPLHTMVDFYTHIKGIEYIICVAFFVVFPLFFRFVDRQERKTRVLTEREKE